MYIFWTILFGVCTFIAGFTYGRMVGINAMLQLGSEIYPNFKDKLVNYIINKEKK